MEWRIIRLLDSLTFHHGLLTSMLRWSFKGFLTTSYSVFITVTSVSYKRRGLNKISSVAFDLAFCNRTRNPKTDFTYEKFVLRMDFSQEIQIRISWISQLLPFDWEIRKRICKAILVKIGVFFWLIMHARARPLFLRTVSFQILLRISQSKGKKEIQKQISQLWNPFSDFAFDCKSEVRILKSKSRFPNRTHP